MTNTPDEDAAPEFGPGITAAQVDRFCDANTELMHRISDRVNSDTALLEDCAIIIKSLMRNEQITDHIVSFPDDPRPPVSISGVLERIEQRGAGQ